MLSTKAIKNVEQAAHYFLGQDNYYTEGNTLAQERSQWWGAGAKAMGLSGIVEPKRFTELLKGHLPSGQQLGKKVDGELLHRPGFDLTFSAPKSVSLLALLGEDERIFKAINRATDKALALIEREQAKTRIMKDGVLMTERTGKLVVARFLHDLSREIDPQLHTHCVVLNMTVRRDGKWRSLASQLGSYKENAEKIPQGFFEGVRHFQKYYGAVFRAELAYEMRELGYTVEKTSAYGFFEIAGISKESIRVFSQRRQDIEALMKAQGVSGAKAAELATLNTRRPKANIARSELKAIWETKAALKAVLTVQEAQQTVAQARQQVETSHRDVTQHLSPEALALAQSALRESITHLSETQVSLRETELLARAIYYSMGETPTATLCTALEAAQKQGDLIPLSLKPDERGERYFTTPVLLRDEQTLLQIMAQSHPSGEPIVASEKLQAFLREHGDLTPDQRQALRTLFSSDQLIGALVGPTGSGKTHLIAPMMTLAKLGGYQPILLTSTAAETLDLKKQLHTTPTNLQMWFQSLFEQKQVDTVFGFLKRQESLSTLDAWFQKKPLFIVDKATQLPMPQATALATVAQRLNGRLIVIGDPQSALTWRTGTPLTQLLANGVVTAHLTGQHRSPDTPLRTAITETLNHNIKAAFEQIGQRIVSVENPEQRWERMAAHWAELSTAERARSLILAPNRSTTDALNVAVREALKQSGEIDISTERSMTILLPHYKRVAEQRIVRHYQVGQWIRFHQDYRSLSVHRGDYHRIDGIDVKNNELLLTNDVGKIRRWDPGKVPEGAIEVFDAKSRSVAVGDQLIWQRSDKRQGFIKGERITVTSITEKKLTVMPHPESGASAKLRALDWRKPSARHFEYGYALTPSQASHRHPDIVIAYQSSGSRQSHQRAFYSLLAQAKSHAWIYTENKAQLLKTVQRYSGDKLTAIDAVLQAGLDPSIASAENLTSIRGSEHVSLLEKAVGNAIQRLQTATPELSEAAKAEKTAKEAVRYALAYLSEKEAAFAHKEVMTVALTHVFGQVRVEQLQAAVVAAEKQGELIRGVYSHNGTDWTTREALTLERQIVAMAKAGVNQMKPLIPAETVEAFLQTPGKAPLSAEHTRVLRELSSQTNRIMLLQGFAGTGKTTLLEQVEFLKHLDQALAPAEKALLCLAPTHQAVKEIRARHLVGQTLDRFLLNYQAGKCSPADYQGKLLVVDESSMASNRRLHDFMVAVIQLDALGLLVGDIRQYTSIDAGKPFEILQKVGIPTVKLTQITRQKDDMLKTAVQQLYRKEFTEVFETLDKHIIEVGGYLDDQGKCRDDREERLEKIAEDYLSRDVQCRAQTLIITFGNADRILQNALIREGLKQQGELTGPAVTPFMLVSRQLSEVERSQVMHYQQGDLLRFNVSYGALGIQKGDYWTVAQVLPDRQRLELVQPGRDPIVWKPRPYRADHRAGVEVYTAEKRELMAGDLIRWTRTDEKLGLLSPELARVESVHSKNVTVRSLQLTDQGLKPHGQPIELTLDNPRMQHWDHAYAMTGYSAQGKTIGEVIINAESFRPQLTSQPSLLVAITRAVDRLTLYTDNKAALLNAILKNPGDKSSALEIMGEASPQQAFHLQSLPKPPQPRERETFDIVSPAEEADSLALWDAMTADSQNHPEKSPLPASPSPEETDKKPISTTRLDAQRISALLTDQAEAVVEQLLGEPKTRTGGQYRYGSKQGSLVITLAGDKRGLWHDFQTGQGGHLLDLIAMQKNLDKQRDFRAVLEEALKLLGTSPADISVQAVTLTAPKSPPKAPNVASQALTPEQQRSLRYARQLARESQPVSGTLAEQYLREHRGITLETFPDNVRFHPGIYSRRNEASHPALLVVAKDNANKVQAVQAIFLDKYTAQKADVSVKKQTWGRPSQGSVSLVKSSASAGVTYLAEGPETALSVYTALNGADVRITLGKSNFKNIDPKTTSQNIVLCLDNDGQNPHSDQLIHMAASKLQEQGKQVWIAQPKMEGQDYNDVLIQQGQAAVKSAMQQAMPYPDYRDQQHRGLTLSAYLENQSQRVETEVISVKPPENHPSIQTAIQVRREEIALSHSSIVVEPDVSVKIPEPLIPPSAQPRSVSQKKSEPEKELEL
jgi:conjugative transfer relaxase protein TraI